MEEAPMEVVLLSPRGFGLVEEAPIDNLMLSPDSPEGQPSRISRSPKRKREQLPALSGA